MQFSLTIQQGIHRRQREGRKKSISPLQLHSADYPQRSNLKLQNLTHNLSSSRTSLLWDHFDGRLKDQIKHRADHIHVLCHRRHRHLSCDYLAQGWDFSAACCGVLQILANNESNECLWPLWLSLKMTCLINLHKIQNVKPFSPTIYYVGNDYNTTKAMTYKIPNKCEGKVATTICSFQQLTCTQDRRKYQDENRDL